MEYCLREEGLKPADLSYVGFYDKPITKFERLLETYLAMAPGGYRSFRQAIPLWIKEKLFQKSVLIKDLAPFAPSGRVFLKTPVTVA